MSKYDDASWHYGGDYSPDLPIENGATHIGFFITWCVDNNLISDFQLEESGEDIKRIELRQMTGREFLLNNCDEKFTDEDLNSQGNSFAEDYYSENSEFAKEYSSYLKDYDGIISYLQNKKGLAIESIYHVDDSWEIYEIIKAILDDRFIEWKHYRRIE